MADKREAVRLDERLALWPAEAARALGIGERTLRQLLPTLPHLRAGGHGAALGGGTPTMAGGAGEDQATARRSGSR